MTDGMSERRLLAIVDAYGADPARWPDAEREAAEALLAMSPAARARRAAAAALDACLDAMPAVEPAPGLAARIVAAAPPRRPRGRRRAALLVPLAAAAAVAVWLVREPPRGTGSDPRAADLAGPLGALDVPTDALLDVAVLDSLTDDSPAFGCLPGGLGCPDPGAADDEPQSRRPTRRNPRA